MWFYVAVLTLIILNCIGFYKDKIMIWSVPVGFFLLEGFIQIYNYSVGEYSSFFAMISEYGMKIIYDFIPLFFAVSLLCSLITTIIRCKNNKKKLSKTQKKE